MPMSSTDVMVSRSTHSRPPVVVAQHSDPAVALVVKYVRGGEPELADVQSVTFLLPSEKT